MPRSVTFCWRLSNSTQNGSASGCAKSTPVPTFWVLQRNGLLPSYGAKGSALEAVASASASASAKHTAVIRLTRPSPFGPVNVYANGYLTKGCKSLSSCVMCAPPAAQALILGRIASLEEFHQ